MDYSSHSLYIKTTYSESGAILLAKVVHTFPTSQHPPRDHLSSYLLVSFSDPFDIAPNPIFLYHTQHPPLDHHSSDLWRIPCLTPSVSPPTIPVYPFLITLFYIPSSIEFPVIHISDPLNLHFMTRVL